MRLVAVFIQDNNYEYGGYTLNFGGNFHYNLKFGDGNTRISRKRNENYIDNFFDDTNTVTNVSAIVGKNGSGKTTTIFEVLKLLNQAYKPGFAFWEEDDICYFNNYNLNMPPLALDGDWKNEIEQITKEVGTIYFSPYLDHKIVAAGIDISADRYLREDLVNIDSTFDANNKVVISERLKRADYKRYINFQKSKFAEKVIQEYGLLNDNLYRVIFIRHEITKKDNKKPKFQETPWDFRDYLTQLFIDIENENNSINRSVSGNVERFELQKNLLKNLILMDLFCLLVRLMEKENTYLGEGHFTNTKEANEVINSDRSAEYKFKYWLSNYYYSKGVKHPLPSKEVIDILEYLYNYIEELTYSQNNFIYMDWTSKTIYFDEGKLFKILDLNENLLNALPKYYLATKDGNQNIYGSVSELQYFVSPEFANRRLSSGETAMLNLYSRLYDFFSRHIINIQTIKKRDYYLMFLDEADLGYHPEWKKSYVNTLINFSRDFFSQLEAKVQIVFTTHDAISLSDIPNSNVVYLASGDSNRILSNDNQLRPNTTFAANVNDLLAHSFFLKDGLMGDFAKDKIEEVISFLNFKILSYDITQLRLSLETVSEKKKRTKKLELEYKQSLLNEIVDYGKQEFSNEYITKLIKMIDEPLLRHGVEQLFNKAKFYLN